MDQQLELVLQMLNLSEDQQLELESALQLHKVALLLVLESVQQHLLVVLQQEPVSDQQLQPEDLQQALESVMLNQSEAQPLVLVSVMQYHLVDPQQVLESVQLHLLVALQLEPA